MAEKVEIFVSNYRLLKDLKTSFEVGNLYLVNASNKKGKTSFINLIQDMFEAKSTVDTSVSFGEESGEAKMKLINFNGEDGQNYILKYEYGASDKFTLIMPDGGIKKKVTDIRDVFKYQRMTVDKFFQLGTTAEGRKMQSKFIKNLIPEEVNKRIIEIDAEINEKTGTLFVERGKLNAQVDALQSIIKEYLLTDNEKEALKVKDSYIKATNELREEYNTLNDKKLSNNVDALKEQITSIDEIITSSKDAIIENEEEILLLQQKIKKLTNTNEELKETIKTKESQKEEINTKIKESKFSDEDEQRLATLVSKLELRDANVLKLDALSIKYTNLVTQQKKLEEQVELRDQKNTKLATLRDEKKSLISKAKLPEKLVIIEDELFYDDGGKMIPFNEDNISYATGGKEIIRLIAQVNKDLPIIVIGKAAEYDPKSIDELAEMAKQYNKILICDYVSSNDDIQIVCYQKGEL